MNTKIKDLNIDYIGGLKPLTKEEEKALSDHFKKRKLISSKKIINSENKEALEPILK